MRIGVLTGSVSRHGAGVFEALRGVSIAVSKIPGVDVEVFGIEDDATEADRALWGGLPVHTAAARGPRAFGYTPGLYESMRAADLDLLHICCMWMYPTLLSLRWMRETGKPVVVSAQGFLDPWAFSNKRWMKEIAAALYERRHLDQAAALHAVADSEMRSLRAFGLKNPIAVIPNGVNPPGNAPAGPPPWSDRTGKTLLFLGRVHAKKNIIPLIEAWAQVSREERASDPWQLAIAGWDQAGYEAQCKAVIDATGAPRVHFIGPQHGLAKHNAFKSATAFVLPSLSEGLPLAVLEAWSYGLPVVMTPECNIPEGAHAGAAIEIGTSAAAITPGLKRLFRMSDAELAQMSGNALRLVEERFTWTQIGADMHTLYRWLINGAPPPSRLHLAEGAAQRLRTSERAPAS
ncbi:MAG: glycosyltransferase [Hyphomonadaceae bacterium]|nr:glycosyltransferase [Hyphomonadaceae bacterium]